MKRILLLIVMGILFVFSACEKSDGQQNQNNEAALEEDKSAEAETAEYEVLRRDTSLTNEAGEKMVIVYYDEIVLKESRQEYAAINQLLHQEYEDFLATNGDQETLSEFLNDPYISSEDPYYSTVDTNVTYNADGVFSVLYGTDWMMGGVHDFGTYGKVYNLRTGKEAALTDLFHFGENDLLEYCKAVIKKYIAEHSDSGWFGDAMERIEGYTLEDLDYYIEKNGEMVFNIHTYDLAPGASDFFQIETGLYLDSSQNLSAESLEKRLVASSAGDMAEWYHYEPVYDEEQDLFLCDIYAFSFNANGDASSCIARLNSGVADDNGNGHYTVEGFVLKLSLQKGTNAVECTYDVIPIGQALLLKQTSPEGAFEGIDALVLQEVLSY